MENDCHKALLPSSFPSLLFFISIKGVFLYSDVMDAQIKDSEEQHWVYRAPKPLRPYLQLARYDRPVGYWLLALPGWMGLAFASLNSGFNMADIKWALLILIGAVAMRGAGCTYNDIIDRDLDAQVERTALRPIPAGTISVMQAWLWLFAQCAVGLIVLLCLPRLAQIIALCSVPLVAAYPFMKRITWWPQAWLGLTFNWAVLVAYAAKTGYVTHGVILLYVSLIFWTIFYDTIYACQDTEDDALIGVKSTARLFGDKLVQRLSLFRWLILFGLALALVLETDIVAVMCALVLPLHLHGQEKKLGQDNPDYLALFKSNMGAALRFILALLAMSLFLQFTPL